MGVLRVVAFDDIVYRGLVHIAQGEGDLLSAIRPRISRDEITELVMLDRAL